MAPKRSNHINFSQNFFCSLPLGYKLLNTQHLQYLQNIGLTKACGHMIKWGKKNQIVISFFVALKLMVYIKDDPL